jgi:hypothetical protein
MDSQITIDLIQFRRRIKMKRTITIDLGKKKSITTNLGKIK